jgi:hypothetical protein
MPSTLHGRDGLQVSLLAMLLSRTPEADETLLTRAGDLAKNEYGLPQVS